MFNVTKVQNNLYGVVGVRQPLNPDYPVIDAGNLGSTSGEYVTNNPNCKIEYLYDNQDYKDLSDSEFNTVLENMQKDSIVSVAHNVFNKPSYIDRQVLYPYANNRKNTFTLPDGFIGHKIKVDIDKDIAFEITRVMLNFEGTGDLELRLFNSSQDTPLENKTITISSTNQVEVLNWRADNSENTYKGEYYFGYRSNTAGIGTLKPYKRDYDNANSSANITHLFIEDVYFEGVTTDTLPDLDTDKGLDDNTGLNPDITVFDDYTDLITQNKFLFARAINLDMQIKFIEAYMATLRSNLNERNSNLQVQRLIQVIEGEDRATSTVKVTGLRPQLSRAISQITKELDKLNRGYLGSQMWVDTMV